VLAGQHRVHQRAQRVDVRAGVDLVAADLLGRHEVGRADDLGLVGRPARRLVAGAELGQAEVEHLGEVAAAGGAGDQHVLGLEVAVDDAEVVGLDQRAADLEEQRRGARPRHRPVAADERPEVGAADVLHDQVQRARHRAEVEDLDGVRVVQARHRRGLALEPAHDLGILGEVRVQDLHRRDLAHAQVLDLVDHAHAAVADQLGHPVATVDHLAQPRLVRRGHPAVDVGAVGDAARRRRQLGQLAVADALAARRHLERRRALHVGAALAAVPRGGLVRRAAARADEPGRGGRGHDDERSYHPGLPAAGTDARAPLRAPARSPDASESRRDRP